MNLQLTWDEIQTLEELLHDCLPELKFEVTRTDDKDFRHILLKRQTLCQELLDRLNGTRGG
jgi:hypothetical protein